ncbi:hypothetical protein NG54_12435 [Heyndrickxia ginsengihumi]|uniref:Uncharacterized protein n=1 Tax=Heyndrickxia ginsengihumi TaxID=363870 RepID=A0A0A6XXU7_9BACI|nr:hypothetical protein NG54_12435 [Heyndrickxia ginsengihumi]
MKVLSDIKFIENRIIINILRITKKPILFFRLKPPNLQNFEMGIFTFMDNYSRGLLIFRKTFVACIITYGFSDAKASGNTPQLKLERKLNRKPVLMIYYIMIQTNPILNNRQWKIARLPSRMKIGIKSR